MASFYIDYENVHNGGTAGIEQLTQNEYVFIFYSQSANTMNIATVKHLLDSRCGIDFVETETGTPNSLDFQLVTFLFTGTDQDDYHYIISKDKGFDAAIKMGNRVGIENVKRFTSIIEAYKDYRCHIKTLERNSTDENIKEKYVINECNQEKNEGELEKKSITMCQVDEDKCKTIIKEKIKRIVQKNSNITLPREELEISCEGICNCDNKMKLYHFLRKQLGDKRGRCVYEAIGKEFLQIKLELAI